MKRLFAFILTACLVFSLVPTHVVFAAGEGEAVPQSNTDGHTHYACLCAIEGANTCAGHDTQAVAQWTAWTNTATLPTTTGNYYLTGNITLTNTAAMTIAAGQTVNLCLNGFSVRFNGSYTGNVHNYVVSKGATLTVMNCQAKLDEKGLFVSGNKAVPTDLTAGRMQGGRTTKGGAFLVEGTCNLYGVEFYDNGLAGKTGYGGAIRMQSGGVLHAVHAKFDSNNGSCGAAIANNAEPTGTETGEATITLDDTILSNNKGSAGGPLYLYATAKDNIGVTATIKGDSRITGNSSGTGSGGAAYLYGVSTRNVLPKLKLQDNVVITGNTAGSAKSGAVVSDAGILEIEGNVQIAGNLSTKAAPTALNVRMGAVSGQKNLITITGPLGPNARIGMPGTEVAKLRLAGGVTMEDTAFTGLFVENTKEIGYSKTGGFYQAESAHTHYNGACAITGDTACTHAGEEQITYLPWFSTTSLPTKGNYYLVYDVVATTNRTGIPANDKLNLCLNGNSIQFNANNTAESNYSIVATAEMNLINCQAKLDDKGLMECGDKRNPADETAGRLFGSRGTNGAVYVEGKFIANGVEFYGNQNRVESYSYGGAIVMRGNSTVTVNHSKFTDNQTNGGGGILATRAGNPVVVLHDIVATGNKAANGGLLYSKIWASTACTRDSLITISGDSLITGNTSTSSGSVSYVARDTNAPAGITCQIELKDNVKITGNTSSGTNGAVVMDCGSTTVTSYLTVSDNVQLYDNVNTKNSNRSDACLNVSARLKLGEMGPDARVEVFTGSASSPKVYADPDEFIIARSGAQFADTASVGVVYESVSPVQYVGYSEEDHFYFSDGVTPPAPPHTHQLCACVLENSGTTGCAHGTELKFKPWKSTTSLPTAGNWYLTQDLVVTDANQIVLAKDEVLNLCLNGFSIKFNPDIAKTKDQTNYYMDVGSEMNIINCQAKLNAKGLLECGNKNDPTNETAGRLFGGRGLYGGAIYVKGQLTVIGVEFYDNQAVNTRNANALLNAYGGALRLQEGGIANIQHCKFDSNKAYVYGGAISVTQGNAELYLHDTVLTNNEVMGVYKDANGNLFTEKQDGTVIDESRGRGGAIYFQAMHMTNKASNNITKDPVLAVTGDSLIQGNATDSQIGNQGGAIALVISNVNGFQVQMRIEDDAQILDNTARGVGGAIYVNQYASSDSASITLADNVKINGNRSEMGNGGAIYVNQAVTTDQQLEMTIRDNVQICENVSAVGNGGAICLAQNGADQSVKLDITGNVLIADNTAGKGNGGAICMLHNSTTAKPMELNITGDVKLTGNKAFADGGAIAVKSSGIVNIGGNVQITENTAGSRGGGLFIQRPVNIVTGVPTPSTMTPQVTLGGDLSITGNKATGNGGGVYISNDDHTVPFYLNLADNVQIKGNSTEKNGPNLYLWANVGQTLGQKLRISGLTEKAQVYTTVNLGNASLVVSDPDQFMVRDENVALADSEACGVIFESINPPVAVGFSNKENTLFYFAGQYAEHKDHALCVCVLTGDAGCKHTDTMVWSQWIYTDKLPTTTGNYYLTGDVVITSNVGGSLGVFEVAAGQKVNLCLNGYSIKFNEKNNSKANYYALPGSELNIINCQAKLDKNNHLVPGNGGKITKGRGMYGGAVYLKGNMTLIGVELADNKVVNTQSQNAMANGYGGAIRVQAGGILRATSCLFRDNKALVYGGAIAVGQGDAEVYLHDTVLKNNEVIGVYTKSEKVDGKTVSTLSTTAEEGFKLDESKGRGGAIHVNILHLTSAGNGITKNPVLALTGNTLIQGNWTNEKTGGQGGAIAITNQAPNGFRLQVTIQDNVQILDNSARTVGGAIYVNYPAVNGAPQITIKDNVKISGNKTLLGNGGACYFNITGKNEVPLELTITDNAEITGNSSASEAGAIYMQHTAATGEAGVITLSGNAKVSNNSAASVGGAFVLKGAIVMNIADNAQIANNKALTYGGGIHTLKYSSSGKGSELNISGGKITGNQAPGKKDPKTGKMKDGYGGGIYIKQGVVNMTGGEISNNKANNGGGVFFNTTKFTFTKGTITKNHATTNGGGMQTSQFSELIMNGPEAVISYNTSDGPAGGLLIAGRKTSLVDGKNMTKDYGSVMTLINGKIYGNYAKTQGGGIYVSTESRLLVKGGSISGNEAFSIGGGVYILKSEVILSGGSISSNKADYAGGGIATNAGKLHIYGGSVSYNKVNTRGGGLRTYGGTEFVMTGGEFCHNTAGVHGAGISLETDGKITGGAIYNNTVTGSETSKESHGGGIAVNPGTHYYKAMPIKVEISDITFKENHAAQEGTGGALWVNCKATINVKNVTFENNTADRGGAVMVYNLRDHRAKESYANIDKCTFTGNEAVTRGGAIFASYTTESRINDCVFTDNTAGTDGGAIYQRNMSCAWIKRCEFTGNTAGQRAAALFVGDDAELEDLTITGNNSGDGYALYFEGGEFDGESFVAHLVKIGGAMKVHDNIGSKPDAFISANQVVATNATGLTEGTKMHVELAEGILTNTLIGAYDYEGGDLKYVVTAGDRSVTDPELLGVAAPEVVPTEPQETQPSATEPSAENKTLGIGGIIGISAALVVAVVAVIAAVAVKKKKKADTAKDAVRE